MPDPFSTYIITSKFGYRKKNSELVNPNGHPKNYRAGKNYSVVVCRAKVRERSRKKWAKMWATFFGSFQFGPELPLAS